MSTATQYLRLGFSHEAHRTQSNYDFNFFKGKKLIVSASGRRLDKQLEKLHLTRKSLPSDLKAWQDFLTRIEQSYKDAEQDRYLLERSLNISSDEMRTRIERIASLNLEMPSHNKTLEAIVKDHDIEKIFFDILKIIEREIESTQATLYQVTESNSLKPLLVDPSRSDMASKIFNEPSLSVNALVSLQTLKTQKCQIIEKISGTDSDSFLKSISVKHGFDTIWSYPVYNHKEEFQAVLSIYSDLNRQPTADEASLISTQLKVIKMAFKLDEIRQHHEAEQVRTSNASRLTTLGEMAAGLAHEVNNPLAIISGYVANLTHLISQENLDKTEIAESCSAIERSVERVSKIVSSLRLFAKDESKQKPKNMAVKQIIDDTLMLCQNRIRDANIDLDIKMSDENTQLICRPAEISQLLLNLIQNAYEAVKNQDKKWIRIEIEKVMDILFIQIADSGRKLTPEVKQKLFQPFFTTKAVGAGVGLGLSICRAIAESHNGKIALSEKTAYTEFVVTLPDIDSKDLAVESSTKQKVGAA